MKRKIMKRKICVITGTRADYGILFPIMKAIENAEGLKLFVVATGMHLMKEFGYTVKKIEEDGIKIYQKVDISYSKDTGLAMVDSVGKAVCKLAKSFAKLKPDIVVVLGDRGEMLAAAIAASYLDIPIAHLHGGEVSGHVDGVLRHAITKLAHIHFAATRGAQKRILRLGEECWRVFLSGAPALDNILKGRLTERNKLVEKYGLLENHPLILVAQHPVNIEASDAARQMKITLETVAQFRCQTMVLSPNADAGGRSMLRVIDQFNRFPFIKFFANVAHRDYLSLMRYASVLVGNSSSGLIEAPSLKLPMVNVGDRQVGRERGANVIDAPHEKKALVRAIKKALYDKNLLARVKRGKNPYGDGRASQRIIRVLSKINLDKELLQKRMAY